MAVKTFTPIGGLLRFTEVGVVLKYYNMNRLQITTEGNYVSFPDGNKYLYNDSELTNTFASVEAFADQVGTWKKEGQASSGGGADANAVHVNIAAEISAITSKGTPTTNDFLLIEDAADSNNKKKITIGSIPSAADSTAIHNNIANEITAITAKTSLVNADEILIEDSQAGFIKKSVTFQDLTKVKLQEATSVATLNIDTNLIDQAILTAQAVALTIGAPTGGLTNGKKLIIRIKDDGTARAITFNAVFRAIGVTLPTTTVASKTTYLGLVYNSTNTKWDILAVKTEA